MPSATLLAPNDFDVAANSTKNKSGTILTQVLTITKESGVARKFSAYLEKRRQTMSNQATAAFGGARKTYADGTTYAGKIDLEG